MNRIQRISAALNFTRLPVFSLALLAAACNVDTDPTPTRPVARIDMPQSAQLFTSANQEYRLSARALDDQGNSVDAKLTWQSSAPDQVSVDADGNLRAVGPVGSAMIRAEADGIKSAPVYVAVIELHPDTLLIADRDVISVGAPIDLPDGAYPGVGTRYDVLLAIGAAPPIGTIVLAAQTAQVAGRVVESTVEQGRVRVRLEALAMPDLVARYDVNWKIDLADQPVLMDSLPTQRGQVLAATAQRERPQVSEPLFERRFPPSGASPLVCKEAIKAYVKTTAVEAKITGTPSVEIIASRFDPTQPPSRLRVALVGELIVSTRLGMKAEAGLKGSSECILKGFIPLPVLPPPVGVLVQPALPIGIGAAVEGKVEVAALDLTFEGRNGAVMELGIDCGPAPAGCRGLNKLEGKNEFKPHLEHSWFEDMRIELDAHVFFLTGLDVIALGRPINVIDIRVGPNQAVNFGSMKRQEESREYASDYGLKFKAEAKPGSDMKKIVEHLGKGLTEISFSLGPALVIAESPRGIWNVNRVRARPNVDTVDFNMDLASTDYFLLGYNVESVSFRRRREGESRFSTLTTIPVSASGQTRFQWQWQPTDQDVGKNEFAAFVKTKFPVVELEIAKDSIREVEVLCSSAPAGQSRERPQAAGVCKEQWIGNASGVRKDVDEFNTVTPLRWEQDLSLQIGPNISALRPKGSVKVSFLGYKSCTVTPEVFDNFDPVTSLMTIDRNFNPPKYTFNAKIVSEITISCPGTDPLKFSTTVLNFQGIGDLAEQGTVMSGGTSTPQGEYSYRFQLNVNDTPPTAQ